MKNSAPSGPAPGTGAARRAGPRLRAALLVAALALPGAGVVVWAASQSNQGTPQGSQGAPSAATVPGGTGTTTPGGSATPAAPPSGTATAGPVTPATPTAQPTTPAKDPAPVDRKGKTEQELATISQPVAPPVPLTAKKTVKAGITATITELQAVDGEARGIGEIAGPAIRFKVTVSNGTAAAVKLGTALVTVSYGKDETPASPLSGPGTSEFPLTVAAGASASSTLVFGVPLDQRADVRIQFSIDALTPIAAFEGQAPQ